ncbi:DUF4422 domain-containing protein [Actinobacillus pleuropneumoniae]|uniref:DUF4422 domain-containing protein n=1 Tax=Actinobacillus pleuropneumoniae TaxID=715 RepID=UPI0001E49C13|nr:DUF4422 domain-containing protein [Actinobacillus pleuropneumoniae]EFM95894.1 Exopolysaccharide biosynthesis protein [Actinobacillus pleuropneumoniae serovar 10 str. D13039]UKH33279.1 DUF4422 domain-containing protein [Actinobacillus pleuropneumoniae serovar 10 str. D13039]
MSRVKILIATHKNYEFPNTACYVPIYVGKALHRQQLAIQGDDTGDNISVKNGSFCELTALYWAWKNDAFAENDYVGLVHYRRYFKGSDILLKGKRIASENELLSYLVKYDAVVAKKRNYYIESVYSHYKNAHYIKDLDLTKKIIERDFPEYVTAFEQVMSSNSLHLFNMFVLKREYFEQYCAWLFAILFKLEKLIDISGYDNYQKRVFGFLAERLFNVWLLKNKLSKKEIKVITLEKEKILLKVIGLLKRKFLKRSK